MPCGGAEKLIDGGQGEIKLLGGYGAMERRVEGESIHEFMEVGVKRALGLGGSW